MGNASVTHLGLLLNLLCDATGRNGPVFFSRSAESSTQAHSYMGFSAMRCPHLKKERTRKPEPGFFLFWFRFKWQECWMLFQTELAYIFIFFPLVSWILKFTATWAVLLYLSLL